ncbi:sensor histidine kinase [Duganella sp. HH105]|uniref:sensor histidine kinase n=1 Tax=Duganella sp. HH105 TaxID=1781067 RepID=UPI000892B8DB|nr:ATP-binding protein [Duganella sp. HH105]OEZ62517.1 sensor histidine kinase LiaS [Duganella sp. HH105]
MSSLTSTPLLLLSALLLACLALGGVLLACLRGAGRRHQRRLARMAEREQAAYALQDMLLQNMQGMILRFQGVSHRLPDGSAERATIETILDQADEVLAEGRQRILALHVPAVRGDQLSRAFAALGQSLQQSFNTGFHLIVSAAPAPLTAELSEEIYRIVREALYNAFQHAGAGQIELELVYGCEFFSLYVRDDGKGMALRPPSGYRGVAAMRARAELLGGSVELLSLEEQGTEVILKIPARLCYQQPCRAGWWRRLAAWLGRADHLG